VFHFYMNIFLSFLRVYLIRFIWTVRFNLVTGGDLLQGISLRTIIIPFISNRLKSLMKYLRWCFPEGSFIGKYSVTLWSFCEFSFNKMTLISNGNKSSREHQNFPCDSILTSVYFLVLDPLEWFYYGCRRSSKKLSWQ